MYEKERQSMVEQQIVKRGISNETVIHAMTLVPRHIFLPNPQNSLAHGDFAIPIGQGQTISQPYIVAMMLELLDPAKEDKVLEIGSGSGYVSALLSRMCRKVIGIERTEALVEYSKERLKQLKTDNTIILQGDGSLGAIHYQPFDKILVSAALPEIPKTLIDQLKPNGIIVAPVGERMKQKLVKFQKLPNGSTRETYFGECAFVPIIGMHGFQS